MSYAVQNKHVRPAEISSLPDLVDDVKRQLPVHLPGCNRCPLEWLGLFESQPVKLKKINTKKRKERKNTYMNLERTQLSNT